MREDGVDVFVELDVGSDDNSNDEQIRSVLYNVVEEGAIASYVTSVQGFQFRRLGEGEAEGEPELLSLPMFRWRNLEQDEFGHTRAEFAVRLAPSAALAALQGSALNLSLWFLAEPSPPVEPIAAPGLYWCMASEPTVEKG